MQLPRIHFQKFLLLTARKWSPNTPRFPTNTTARERVAPSEWQRSQPKSHLHLLHPLNWTSNNTIFQQHSTNQNFYKSKILRSGKKQNQLTKKMKTWVPWVVGKLGSKGELSDGLRRPSSPPPMVSDRGSRRRSRRPCPEIGRAKAEKEIFLCCLSTFLFAIVHFT